MVCDRVTASRSLSKQTPNHPTRKRVLHTLKLGSPHPLKVNVWAFSIRDLNSRRGFSLDISSVVSPEKPEPKLAPWLRFSREAWPPGTFLGGPNAQYHGLLVASEGPCKAVVSVAGAFVLIMSRHVGTVRLCFRPSRSQWPRNTLFFLQVKF